LKKILTAVILISLIAAAWSLTGRIAEIDSSNRVEIVLDGGAYQQLKALEPQVELAGLKASGVSGTAVYQKSIDDFLESGALQRLNQLDLALLDGDLSSALEEENISAQSLSRGALFAVISDGLREQLNRSAQSLEENYSAEFFSAGQLNLLYFENWSERLNELNLGYNAQLAAETEAAGMDIIYRSGAELNALPVLKSSLEELNAEMLIFDGEEVTGFPAQLEETAAVLKENALLFGYIEAFIADQSGAKEIAELSALNILRTHSMQQEEVDTSSQGVIVDRYLRAVRERSVRVIYFKPYLTGTNLMQRNEALLSSLKSELQAEGYIIGDAEAASFYSADISVLLLLLLGVTAAGILMLYYFTELFYNHKSGTVNNHKSDTDSFNYDNSFSENLDSESSSSKNKLNLSGYQKYLNIFFLFSAVAAFLLLQSGREVLLRQITAFGAAAVFPTLAVAVFLLNKKNGGEEIASVLNSKSEETGGKGFDSELRSKKYSAKSFFDLFINYTFAVLTALSGGIFVSAALNSSNFIFKLEQFRGVKAAFILPLILISIYYFLQLGSSSLKRDLLDLFEAEIKVKHLILAGILALTAVIYIGRTGNFPLLPVPNWEMLLRSQLEKLLYVRPRFKEFLIGHPLLIFSLWLASAKRKKLYFYPLLMLASVGVVTTVNTFSHLHTPVLISVLRTFHSYWLALIIGAGFIIIYELFSYIYKRWIRVKVDSAS